MIQTLRFRFIRLAVLFQLLLLIVLVVFSNYASYLMMVRNADTVIDELGKESWTTEPQAPEPRSADIAALQPASLEEPAEDAAEPSLQEESSEEPAPVPEEMPFGPEEERGRRGFRGNKQFIDWQTWQETQDWTWEDWQAWWQTGGYEQPPVSEEPSPEITEPEPDSELPPSPPPAPAETPSVPTAIPFESRYFLVTEDADGSLLSINMEHITSVSPAQVQTLIRQAKNTGADRGFLGTLRYRVQRDGSTVSYLFLDCGQDLTTFRNSLIANCLISLLGIGVVLVLMVLVSGRMVKPVAESYEKQKQFISAAGHELRTPLTVINADAELLGMEIGENEWLQDIETQAGRMSELTNSLLSLARMDEGRETIQMIEFPVSDIVAETAASFEALAQSKGKTIETSIEPMRSMVGSESAIRQLTSILLDNAVKYSLGRISVSLRQQDSNILLTVSNHAEPVSQAQLSQLFDRFYRTETSRNSETGGYGLGLAIAKSIVDAHRGKITAQMTDSETICFSVTLPRKP